MYNYHVTQTICQVAININNYPQLHTKASSCVQIDISKRNHTVPPSFEELVRMHVLTQEKGACDAMYYGIDQILISAFHNPPQLEYPEPKDEPSYPKTHKPTKSGSDLSD